MQPQLITYRSSDVRCPSCHQWRRELWIEADGSLRCRPCPALGRGRREGVVMRAGAGQVGEAHAFVERRTNGGALLKRYTGKEPAA
jgi:hypothetical protein